MGGVQKYIVRKSCAISKNKLDSSLYGMIIPNLVRLNIGLIGMPFHFVRYSIGNIYSSSVGLPSFAESGFVLSICVRNPSEILLFIFVVRSRFVFIASAPELEQCF